MVIINKTHGQREIITVTLESNFRIFKEPLVVKFTALHSTVLYWTVLYCTVLHCTVLYCTVLYCIQYYILLYDKILLYIILHSFALYEIVKFLSIIILNENASYIQFSLCLIFAFDSLKEFYHPLVSCLFSSEKCFVAALSSSSMVAPFSCQPMGKLYLNLLEKENKNI